MTTDTPRTDAFGNNLVKCYCPRCIVGVHDDIQLAAQYRKHAEWRERAEKAEAEVEKLDKERRELSRELHLWEMGMYHKIDELQAEVERLRGLVNESIVEKSTLSMSLVNCQDNLRRAIEIAKDLDSLGPYRVGGPFEIQ